MALFQQCDLSYVQCAVLQNLAQNGTNNIYLIFKWSTIRNILNDDVVRMHVRLVFQVDINMMMEEAVYYIKLRQL